MPNQISILVTIITVTVVFIFFSSDVDFLIYSISFRNMITKFQMMKLKNNGKEIDTLMFKKILFVTVIFLFSCTCNKIVKSLDLTLPFKQYIIKIIEPVYYPKHPHQTSCVNTPFLCR